MKWFILQIVVLFSPVMAGIQGNVEGASLALHANELRAPLSETHQGEGAKQAVLIRQGGRRQSNSDHQMEEALDHENREFIAEHDTVKKPKKKFSAYIGKFFGGAFKYIKKFFKFLISEPTPVHRTGKGTYQVPRLAAFFHIEKPWALMDESPEVMKEELAKFTHNDLMSQVVTHQSFQEPLYKMYAELTPSSNIAEMQSQELQIKHEAENFIMKLRTNLESLPDANVALEDREKEKQVLTVKTLYILSQDPKYSGQAIEAMSTALFTWSQRPNPMPKLHRYMMAAHDLMTKPKPEASPLSTAEEIPRTSSPAIEMPQGYPGHTSTPKIEEVE